MSAEPNVRTASAVAEDVADRRIMVTGGCGFIGSHLVARLLDRGATDIVIVDHLRYGAPRPEWADDPRVRLVHHAIGLEPPDALRQALRGVNILAHLAAEKHNQAIDRPDDVLLSNVVGTRWLFDAAADDGVEKIVFSSSLYAYGRVAGEAMEETETPGPTTVYGASKLCGEHLLAATRERTGVDAVSLRYFFAYGPGQGRSGGYRSVIPTNFDRLARGEPPRIRGDGQQALDYVFIDDLVDATIRAMLLNELPSPINVASGTATTISQLTSVMTEVAGAEVAPAFDAPDWTAGTRRFGDTRRASEALGWTARTPLRDGLGRVWEADYPGDSHR